MPTGIGFSRAKILMKECPVLTLSDARDNDRLRDLWDCIQDDPLKPLFWSDWAPQTLEAFIAAVQGQEYACVIQLSERSVGYAQLTGEKNWPGTHKVRAGELEFYMIPEARGVIALKALRLIIGVLRADGVTQLIAPVQRRHRQVRMLLSHMGCYRVGILPQWIPVAGVWHDAVLYSLLPPQLGEISGHA